MEETLCRFRASDGLFQKRSVFANFENFIVGCIELVAISRPHNFAGHLQKSKPDYFELRQSQRIDRV
ncbi:hypothetical protein GBA52_029020 [Prunus armeniaca]|nr:hypothetical protein GBA52_029020 [Prunus armeniaca]